MKIKGFVDEHGCPRIFFQSITGQKLSLVVDTGFNGALCLPKYLIQELDLQHMGTYEIELADGSVVLSQIYSGEIIWFRKKKEIIAHATESKVGLVGTQLLHGVYFEMDIDKNIVMITESY